MVTKLRRLNDCSELMTPIVLFSVSIENDIFVSVLPSLVYLYFTYFQLLLTFWYLLKLK